MAPYIEVKCQAVVAVVGDAASELTFGTHWEPVPKTDHETGDVNSENAKRAHELLASDPNCREVKDKKGEPCSIPVKSANIGYGGLLFQPKEKG